MAQPRPERLTNRRVLKIALPIVLSNATVPILGAVDTGVVGQMGLAAPIGAVGIGAVILTAVYWVFGFLRMGTTGLVSQAEGAGDQGEVSAMLTRVLLIGAGAGGALILLQPLVFALGFWLSPASPEVEGLARDYMRIRIFSAPAAIAIYGATGWLIAREQTRAVLVLQLWMNGLNIGLDLLFVLGFAWGVSGVALATVIAEWGGLALAIYMCRAAFAHAAWRSWARVFDRVKLIRMAKVNSDILIRSLLLQSIILSFVMFGARFGDVTLAANQVLLQFLSITAFALDGFAFAAEALVGQAMGARARSALRQAAILVSLWAFGGALVLALVFAGFGGGIIDIMTTAPEVRETARLFLPYMIAAPILGVAAWMLDGIFIGATRSADMRNMMVISVLIYGAALAILMPLLGNHGIWAALLISYVARGVTLAWRYPDLEADIERESR
ncbi:MAG: MATE family efflux transporter [Paracoccaceae bacterium]